MSDPNQENSEQQQNQGQDETGQPEDAITLLGRELQEIRQALGLGEGASSSSLMQRLNSIEAKLAQPQRERNLPKTITWQQAGSLNFMRKHGIKLEDINSGRVKVVKGEG